MSLIEEDFEHAEMFRLQAKEEENSSDSEDSEAAGEDEPRLQIFQATGTPGRTQLPTKPQWKS